MEIPALKWTFRLVFIFYPTESKFQTPLCPPVENFIPEGYIMNTATPEGELLYFLQHSPQA